MEIFQIVGLGLAAIIMLVILNEQKSIFGIYIIITFGVLIFILMMDKISAILIVFKELSAKAGVNLIYVSTIFKVVGIAYLTEFSAEICRDAGSSAIAGKIEFAGKIIIITLAIPILAAILEAILQLIP